MEQKTFLLADDDIDDRELFCEALGSIDSNITCRSVTNGRELLTMLHSMQLLPQLIFLDINMPLMNGWECLKKLKEDEQYHNIPVIIISTSSHQREMDIAKSLDALCYFTKPPQFTELTQVLRSIVTNIGPELAQTLQNLDSGSQYIHVLG